MILAMSSGDAAEETAAVSPFVLQQEQPSSYISSLRHTGNESGPEFIRPGRLLGPLLLRIRSGQNPWRDAGGADNPLKVTSTLCRDGNALMWDLAIRNTGREPIEIGDLGLPLPMNTDYTWDTTETFERRVFKHAFIAGHGSFLYWLPVKGTGPILVMQPRNNTTLELFTETGMDYAKGCGHYTVFVHSRAIAEQEKRGSWRQPHTGRTLRGGEEATYGFAFRWAGSYQDVRALLRDHGGMDVHVAPGMVVPRDLTAMVALRSQRRIIELAPEFPAATVVEPAGERDPDTRLYRIRFSRLGENLITIRCADGWTMPLEFFVTEPLETLIRKRAAFIATRQQHRDPAKWYDGLFSLWDRRQPQGKNLLGPDNLAGQPEYAVASDDPADSKCLFLAEKNTVFPDAREIEALEYFIRNFVWGKLQRTDRDTPYPYGIYGADSWKQNRFAERDPLSLGISRPGGPSACRMWRTFDYTTYFALYFNLYRIAKQRPDLVHYLDAAGYLERAFGTARAYFEVPAAIRMDGGWSHTGRVYWQYTIGNFHEKYLLPLIAALESEGRQADADFLRGEWEKKVKYFIYDNRYAFASEMPVDSTAYESTYAAGHYALGHGLKPDTNLWHDLNLDKWFSHPAIDPRRHDDFLKRQHMANLACRGVLEANYWSLGSDFRACGSASYTLSYMSQMGGWAVLDYALRHDQDPAENLRLGYASLLSSWALMNTGDAESGYGYWTRGAMHDGAMSWGFQPRMVGTEWNPATADLPRGAWPVCGEADHGLTAGVEAACTVLFDDPLFGLTAYGGEVREDGGRLLVVPRDGVRMRLSAVIGARRLHLALDRDGFAAGEPIALPRSLDRIEFRMESRSPQAHKVVLTAEGLPAGDYRLACGQTTTFVRVEADRPARIILPVDEGEKAIVVRLELVADRANASRPPIIINRNHRVSE